MNRAGTQQKNSTVRYNFWTQLKIYSLYLFFPQIDQHLENLQQELNTRGSQFGQAQQFQDDAPYSVKNLPQVVENLCWAKSAQKKLEYTRDAVNILAGGTMLETSLENTGDFGTLRSCLGVVIDLSKELAEFCKEQIDQWQVGCTYSTLLANSFHCTCVNCSFWNRRTSPASSTGCGNGKAGI